MSAAATPIDFYFEFSSPYGYIASQLVEDRRKHFAGTAPFSPEIDQHGLGRF